MFFIVNLTGILVIIFIVWWFWFSHKKAMRINNKIISIEVKNGVYLPSRIEVPSNREITLEFLRKDASSCSEYVVFDTLNIHVQLPLNKKYERSTGQAPWFHGRPKGRVQAALAPCLPVLDAQCTSELRAH